MKRARMFEIIREEGFAFPGESLTRLCRRMQAEGLRMAAEIAAGVNNYDNPMTAQDVADELLRKAELIEEGGEA